MIEPKEYIKANKKGIISNWRKHEFIREKHNFSICEYIFFYCDHIAESCKVNHEHKDIAEFAKYLYKTL